MLLQGEALIALSASIPTTKDFAALIAALDSLDDRLALRTYLDGHELTVVDWLVWGSIKGASLYQALLTRGSTIRHSVKALSNPSA